jgi:hypothetical protein
VAFLFEELSSALEPDLAEIDRIAGAPLASEWQQHAAAPASKLDDSDTGAKTDPLLQDGDRAILPWEEPASVFRLDVTIRSVP